MAKPDPPPLATAAKLPNKMSTTVVANHPDQSPNASPQLLLQYNARQDGQPDGQQQIMQQRGQQHEQHLAQQSLQQPTIPERLSIESNPPEPSDRQLHRPITQSSAIVGVEQPGRPTVRRGEDTPPLFRPSQRNRVEEWLNNVLDDSPLPAQNPDGVTTDHAARNPMEIGDEETAEALEQLSEADVKPQIPISDRQLPDLTSSQSDEKDADTSHSACHAASTRTSASRLDLGETDTIYTPSNASSAGFSVLSYGHLEGAHQFSQNGDMDEEDDMWA